MASTLLPAADVARRLIDRAEAQHREGVKPFSKARTGLRSVDELAPSWWGLTVLVSKNEWDQLTLAARIALETARAGGRVLWFSLSGEEEAPVFRLLTGMSGVPARSVFVDRNLTTPQWAQLAVAVENMEALQIRVADAHRLSLSDVSAECRKANRTGPLDLVVFDGVHHSERTRLIALEELAEDLDFPVLVLVGSSGEKEDIGTLDHLPLRKGSLVLRARRTPLAKRKRGDNGPIRVQLAVIRVREGRKANVRLDLEGRRRWMSEASEE